VSGGGADGFKNAETCARPLPGRWVMELAQGLRLDCPEAWHPLAI
jgi:hypothetical protein